MNEMELMMQLHRNNQRQGPGSEETGFSKAIWSSRFGTSYC